MSVVALGSLRSAAVTTTALGLARTWPGEADVLLCEVDPAGGALAGTLGLLPEPGLQSLAAEARRGLVPGAPLAHAQAFGALPVLVAPPAAEQVRAAFAMLGDLPAVFGAMAGTVICDCGRLDLASPVLPLFSSADSALIVARGELSDLHVLAASIERRGLTVDRLGNRLGLVLCSGTYGAAEVEEAFGVPVLATLPHDPAGARTLATEAPRGLAWRSPLPRALRSLAEQIAQHLASPLADGNGSPVAPAAREPEGERPGIAAVEVTR